MADTLASNFKQILNNLRITHIKYLVEQYNMQISTEEKLHVDDQLKILRSLKNQFKNKADLLLVVSNYNQLKLEDVKKILQEINSAENQKHKGSINQIFDSVLRLKEYLYCGGLSTNQGLNNSSQLTVAARCKVDPQKKKELLEALLSEPTKIDEFNEQIAYINKIT